MKRETHQTTAATSRPYRCTSGIAQDVFSYLRETDDGAEIVCTREEFDDCGISAESDILPAAVWDDLLHCLTVSGRF